MWKTMQGFPLVNKFTQKREIQCAVLSAPPSNTPPSLSQRALVPPLHLWFKVDAQLPGFFFLSPRFWFYSPGYKVHIVVKWQTSVTLLSAFREIWSTGRLRHNLQCVRLPFNRWSWSPQALSSLWLVSPQQVIWGLAGNDAGTLK